MDGVCQGDCVKHGSLWQTPEDTSSEGARQEKLARESGGSVCRQRTLKTILAWKPRDGRFNIISVTEQYENNWR